MTVQRVPPSLHGTGVGETDSATPDASARRSQRIQMLATEHWSLLATRSLSWSESFARASMFLTLLSGAVVALALVAQATAFGDGFVLFALLLLPVILFVGLATYVRLCEVNNEDAYWVTGMNRLRAAYLEMEPDLARHFVTGTTEDISGLMRTYASHPGGTYMHGFVTTPATIGFVNALVAAVLGVVVLIQWQMTMLPAVSVGGVIFLVMLAAQGVFAWRSAQRYAAENRIQTPQDAARRDDRSTPEAPPG